MTQPDNWTSCYDLNWKGLICDEAFSHPAKYSRGLIFRIIEHALEEGWLQPGGVVLDPFGGVALGALPALMNGLNWIGCELEPRFVDLGRQNIDLWNRRFSGMPRWTGSAQLLQGDSRRLAEVMGAAGLVIGSPPYARVFEGQADKQTRAEREAKAGHKLGGGQINHDRDYGSTPGQLATLPPGDIQAIISSPPYATGDSASAQSITKRSDKSAEWIKQNCGSAANQGYGSTDGQLGEMKPGDISAVISSPPFAGNSGGRGEASRNGIDPALFDRHSGGMKKGTGADPANLDHLPQGTAPITIVSSPPYADGCAHTGGADPHPEHIEGGKNGVYGVNGYGSTEGQLAESPDTFWSAAATIIQQCALLLPVGGAAIWVVKNYIKAGREVDFTGQWQALCEACGFETVHVHRAMLVKHQGVQQGAMEGEPVSKEVSRKSFFRRLHERRRPDLAIDFETVLCTVKKG